MRYDALRYFVEITEQGSINKAAEILYVSQPNLSTAIRNLEKDFNMKLLQRTNKGIQLTENGKEIYFFAKRIFQELDILEQFTQTQSYRSHISLSISMNGIFLCSDLLNGYYHHTHSDQMIFNLHEVGLESVLQDVATLKSDLGIAVVNSVQLSGFKRVIEIKNLEAEKIGESDYLILLGQRHPLFSQASVTAEQLLPYPMIRFPVDYFSEMNYKGKIGAHTIADYQNTITMNNCHSIIDLLKNSDAFFPNNKWGADDLKYSGIKAVPIEKSDLRTELMLVKRKQEILTPSAQAFRDIFVKHYQTI